MFNNKKIHGFLLLAVILTAVGLKLFTYYYPKTKVAIGGKIISVLVADTPTRQFKGLSNKKDLGKYSGMLFRFPYKSRYVIVMKDMNFPIDIVWINDNKVVDLTINAKPEVKNKAEKDLVQYVPLYNVDTILELPTGFVKQNNVKIGDTIVILD
jgi:uncharacterized protein